MQRFRGGLEFKARGLGVSLNSRLESNKEDEEGTRRMVLVLPITRLFLIPNFTSDNFTILSLIPKVISKMYYEGEHG